MNTKLPIVMILLSIAAVSLAVWLARGVGGPEPPVPEQTSVTTLPAAPPNGTLEPEPPFRPEADTPPGIAPSPPVPETPPAAPSASTPPHLTVDQDWLDLHYGLTTEADRAAVDALADLAQTLDFDRFWQQIRPLAADGNLFAQYLALAFRDFLRMDMALLEFGYVEEPYLNQRRRQISSANWLHWLVANWRSDWQPDDDQVQQAFNRALSGDAAAQTLLVSQSGWFSNNPDFASNLEELRARLDDNPYLQVLNLIQLNARVIAQTSEEEAVTRLADALARSRHPLSQWLARRVADTPASPERERAELINLAQEGYLTAVQEAGRLAIRGQGRWTDSTETPIDMNDAITVYLALEAQQPDNPLISVALCELYLEAGDYQASWQYLQKFAYQDAWADEVEDYSCLAGNHRLYGDLMINRGVITEQQWQQHLDTIDARRERIRG